jgi:RNA polymerase sigma-70 factor, ECF subfamily
MIFKSALLKSLNKGKRNSWSSIYIDDISAWDTFHSGKLPKTIDICPYLYDIRKAIKYTLQDVCNLYEYGTSNLMENIAEISFQRLRAGDRAEFARLVEAYSTPIYRLALKMLGDAQDAEDVLQITFLKALQHIQEFEGRSSLSTWLYRIAANEALMLLRRKRPAFSLDESPTNNEGEDAAPIEFTDWCCLPESELLSAEAKQHLDQTIQTLPEKLRVVFILRDIEGLSIKETGEALNLTETAVKTRLLRARLYLREKLSVYFSEKLAEEK